MLTNDQREAVVRRFLAGERQIDLAAEYGVSRVAVCRLIKRRGIVTGCLSSAIGGMDTQSQDALREQAAREKISMADVLVNFYMRGH